MKEFQGFGTTFLCGFKQYLGNDFEKNLKDILGMGFDKIRLVIRWDWCEEQKGNYFFSLYDSLLEIAQKRNVEILLTLGVKAAGWPEYFYPSWFDIEEFMNEINKKSVIGENTKILLNYISSAVKHFEQYKCITAIQVENEALVKYGKNNFKISEFLVKQEVELIRKISKLPIVLTTPSLVPFISLWEIVHLGNPVYKMCEKYADIIGIHVYPHVSMKIFGFKFIFKATWLDWRGLKNKVHNSTKPIWITEFQAEPWEPKHEVFANDFKRPSFTALDLKKYLLKIKNLNLTQVYLWAGEYLLAAKKMQSKSLSS